jgi:hypothetical protein
MKTARNNDNQKTTEMPELKVSERFYLYKNLPSEFQLSGYRYAGRGKQTNEICGTFDTKKHDIHSCECGKTYHHQQFNCKKFECPVCLKDTSYSRGLKITKRVMYAQKFYNLNAFHVSINPNKRQQLLCLLFGVERFEKEIIIPYAKERFEGCIFIFHPDRINDASNMREFSPHWHLIALTHKKYAFSKFDKENMRKDKKYSFVVKFHKNNITNKYQLKNYDDILNVAGYQLSHCAYKRYSIAYRGFGKISGSKLRVRDEFINYIDVELECKHCKTPLYQVEEFEITKSHYTEFVERRIKYLERLLINNHVYGFDHRQIMDELSELKEKTIIDEIRPIKFNKTKKLCCRKIRNIIIPEGTPAINYDTVKVKRIQSRRKKITKQWNTLLGLTLANTPRERPTTTLYDFSKNKLKLLDKV